jgi:hypothetical protein
MSGQSEGGATSPCQNTGSYRLAPVSLRWLTRKTFCRCLRAQNILQLSSTVSAKLILKPIEITRWPDAPLQSVERVWGPGSESVERVRPDVPGLHV